VATACATGVLGAVIGATSIAVLQHHRSGAAGFVVADLVALALLAAMVGARQRTQNRWRRQLGRQIGAGRADAIHGRDAVLGRPLVAEAAALRLHTGADQVAILFDDGEWLRVVTVEGEGPLAKGTELDETHWRVDGRHSRPRVVIHNLSDDRPSRLAVAVATSADRGVGPRLARRLRRVAACAGRDINQAWLDDAEQRSRLGAMHARRQMAMLVSGSGVLARAISDWRPALEALAAELVPTYVDYVAVDLFLDEHGPGRVLALHSDAGLTPIGRRPDATVPGSTMANRAMTERQQAVFVAGGRTDQRPAGPQPDPTLQVLADRLWLDSWMAAPVLARGAAIGMLSVGTSAARRGLRPSDVAAYEELAVRCGLAIERVLLYRESEAAASAAERAASRLARTVEAAPRLTSELDVPDVLAVAAREVVRILGVRAAAGVLQPDGGRRVTATWPTMADEAPTSERLAREAETAGAYERMSRSNVDGTVVLGAPITVTGRRAWAALSAIGAPGQELTADDETVLRLVGQLTGAAIDHALLFEAAAASQRRTKAIVAASPLAILELDRSGAVVAANAAAVEILRWEGKQTQSLPDAALRELRSLVAELVRGEAVIDHRMVLAREDGTTVDLAVAAALIGDDGEHLLCMLNDITERNQLERAVQAKHRMEALGRLAGGVAHDFNNLLTIIVGHSEMMARDLPDDHELQPDLGAIRGAAQRGASFTEQLLTISRRRVGKETVLDLGIALADFEPVLRRLIPDNVRFSSFVHPRAGHVRIDLSQLEQLILNLVVNSCDAMRDGGELSIMVTPSDDGATSVISASDTGVGMDQVTLERCFEPFFTTRADQSGTGLGLATVYGIVVRAGGEITVDSAVGRGTTFRIALPTSADQPSDRDADPERFDSLVPGSGVVLVVEHDDEVQLVMSKALTREGYDVVVAASAGEALIAADNVAVIDLLVTDVVMPGMSGPDLAACLTQRRAGLPVLFVSGYMDDDQRDRVLRLQPRSSFLPKPFSLAQFASAVHAAMDRGDVRPVTPATPYQGRARQRVPGPVSAT